MVLYDFPYVVVDLLPRCHSMHPLAHCCSAHEGLIKPSFLHALCYFYSVGHQFCLKHPFGISNASELISVVKSSICAAVCTHSGWVTFTHLG